MLKQFFADYLAWAETDAPGHRAFSPGFGLCANLDFWANDVVTAENQDYLDVAVDDFHNMLLAEFGEEGAIYPFNEGGAYEYHAEGKFKHRNEKRLAWVRKQLETMK